MAEFLIEFLPGGQTISVAEGTNLLEAARAAAEAAANELIKATNAEEFDKAIAALEINKDAETAPKSSENKDVAHTGLYEEYAEWLSASDRISGDIKAFPSKTAGADGTETVTAYHVLMFQSRNDDLEPLANVRHILVAFQGGTADPTTGMAVYSDEEKAAAKAAAQKIYDSWLAGNADAESFAALANEKSADGDGTTGGLYENVNQGTMVDEFESWCLDKSRKAGDTSIVQTSYGQHIMYFVGASDVEYWHYACETSLLNDQYTAWQTELIETVAAEAQSGMKHVG